MKKLMLMFVLAAAVTGCSVSDEVLFTDLNDAQVMPASSADGDGMLLKIADGYWTTFKYADGISAYYDKSIWIDLQVPNLSYHKVVGIKWTDNNWATVRTSYAVYEASLGDGFERWGVDIDPIGEIKVHRSMGPVYWTDIDGNATHIGYPHRPVVIQYAIFYENDNGTLWNNNNYQNFSITVVE